MRELAEQGARTSESITAQVDRNAAPADRDAAVGSIVNQLKDFHATSVSVAANVDQWAPGIERPSAKPRRFSRSVRAA